MQRGGFYQSLQDRSQGLGMENNLELRVFLCYFVSKLTDGGSYLDYVLAHQVCAVFSTSSSGIFWAVSESLWVFLHASVIYTNLNIGS